VWSTSSGAHVATLDLGERLDRDYGGDVLLQWTGDGKWLVSGGQTGQVPCDWLKIWDTATWTEKAIDARNYPDDLEVSVDGKLAAMIGEADQLTIVEIASGKKLVSRPYSESHAEYRVALSADDSALLMTIPSATGSAIDISRAKDMTFIAEVQTAGLGTAWSPRRDMIASFSGTWAGVVSASDGTHIRAFASGSGDLWNGGNVAWSPNGDRVAGVSLSHGDLQIWDVASGRLIGKSPVADKSGAASISWSLDEGYVIVGKEIFDAKAVTSLRALDKSQEFLAWTGPHEIVTRALGFIDVATGARARANVDIGDLASSDWAMGFVQRADHAFVAVMRSPRDGVAHLVRSSDGARLDLGLVVVDGTVTPIAQREDGRYDGPDGALACLGAATTTPVKTPALLAQFFATASE
jgi:WD40 repeat protein